METLTRQVVEAVGGRDMALLADVLAPEFTSTTGRPGAEVHGRDEWLAVTATRYEVDEAEVADVVVQPLGDDGAVVRYRLVQRARMDGADRSGAFRVTDCWRREAGRWLLSARHATAVAGGGAPERLRVRPEGLAVQRADAPRQPLRAVVLRDEERTTIGPGDAWRAIEVEGTLDLALTGVMARLSGVLAAAGVPLLAVSTHDTDVLLVRAEHLDRACDALRAAGHALTG